jgi:hypothetical protein
MLFPAYIWAGPYETVKEHIITFLHTHLCVPTLEPNCTNCQKIKARQHYQVMWIIPEKSYTLADISPIFEQVALACSPNDHYFFVLAHAHLLSSVCANSLLKSIEEPPRGYHFIFTTPQVSHIIDTIRSRCIINTITTTSATSFHPLYSFFTNTPSLTSIEFAAQMATHTINEHEFIVLCQQLLSYWTAVLRTPSSALLPYSHSMLTLLQKLLEHPPMPGSSKIALRHLFLSYTAFFYK